MERERTREAVKSAGENFKVLGGKEGRVVGKH